MSTGFATVRFWAGARAAAGTAEVLVPVPPGCTVATLTELVLAQVPGTGGAGALARVIASCSVLVGDTPLGTRDPAEVEVPPGETVEYLPPFAGG